MSAFSQSLYRNQRANWKQSRVAVQIASPSPGGFRVNVIDAPRRYLGYRWCRIIAATADAARRWRAILVDAFRLATYPAAMPLPRGFVPPCLPTKAPQPPSGDTWVHEIKHDGFRVIARKDGERVRLYSRPGNDLTYRFPLIVEALTGLRSRSCIIDGEAVACDDNGLASFERIRYRQHDGNVFLYAFDLIELNGDDLRRDPLEVRIDEISVHTQARPFRPAMRNGLGTLIRGSQRSSGADELFVDRRRRPPLPHPIEESYNLRNLI
jgi:hypothetical protein